MTRPSEDEMTVPFHKERAPVGPMFDAFRAAKSIKMPRWAAPLLIAATVFHVLVFVTMWIRSIWDVDQLDRAKQVTELWLPPAPPPPPPPPAGAIVPQKQELKPIKRKVKDLVQIVKQDQRREEIPSTTPPSEVCDPTVETCSDDPNGVKDGQIGAPPAPPAPPPPPPPPPPPTEKFVGSPMIEGQRTEGEPKIPPDDTTKQQMKSEGKDKVVGAFKLCLADDGSVSKVSMMRSTGFGAYDAKIQREMHSWRYRPYKVDNKPIPVCTAITFIYSQPL